MHAQKEMPCPGKMRSAEDAKQEELLGYNKWHASRMQLHSRRQCLPSEVCVTHAFSSRMHGIENA
jgi:hypothetical protein